MGSTCACAADEPVQLMRPGIGQNTFCTLGDCVTSRPEGRLWPRKLWFSIYSCASAGLSLLHTQPVRVQCTIDISRYL